MTQASTDGYYRFPTVHGDRVVFVSEDDLWEVDLCGGVARRLTSGLGSASHPVFSPDGEWVAFTSTEEGQTEVHVMDSRGGPSTQLTFNGAQAATVGWTSDGDIVFCSNHARPFPRHKTLFSVPRTGGEAADMGLGAADFISHQPDGAGRIIARNSDDLARWKRYRGGTAGVLWCDATGEGDWERLFPDETAGHCRPLWVGERIYYVSDFEGYGNIYSCLPDGSDRQRHTDHEGFYARFPHTDGKSIVYTCGGDLYRLDVDAGEFEKIDVEYASPRTQLNRKFVDAEDYLDEFELHPSGHSLVVSTRGKAFNFGNWEGGVRQTGVEQGVRYRLGTYFDDGERILFVSDEGGEEHFEIHHADGSEPRERVDTGDVDIGRPLQLVMVPDEDAALFTNHRQELVHIDLESGASKVIDRSEHQRIAGVDISSDGRWIAYASFESHGTSIIKIVDRQTWEIHDITTGEFRDVDPVFDPKGRYLYFLSHRFFEPVYDQLFFDIGFPKSMRPCVVTLSEDERSPFFEEPRPLDGGGNGDDGDSEDGDEDEEKNEEKNGEKNDNGDDSEDEEEAVEIDFDGIVDRVEAFPVATANYGQIGATEDRVFWTTFPVGTGRPDDSSGPRGTVKYFDLEKRREKTFARRSDGFALSRDGKTIALDADGVRIISASGSGPDDMDDDEPPSRKSGWIDFGRIPVSVEIREEWQQMLREAWRLMRDHFWREDMCGVDWEEAWERYSALLPRLGSRAEFSDLVWIMQGELGTSHAYEFGGDYRTPPQYRPGFLGADIAWDPDFEHDDVDGAYRVEHIVRGDAWNRRESSPLARPGVDVSEGDHIVAVDGKSLGRDVSLQERLVHMACREVELAVVRDDERRTVAVETLASDTKARYREWVDANRRRVHEASDGRVGYVHVPDMSAQGFAEFHRGFMTEVRRKGLVVDVRNNGGGHVSQLLLEKLARRRLGYDINRWSKPFAYPGESVMGPLVALTDEYAGSDGDIFSHAFKMMELGPLIGKRTWGGVIGIWPRHALVDGSVTTQPEFSFWFEDVGFGVENFGTEPDVEVELPPEATTHGDDPQLDAALKTVLELMEEEQPELPDFGPYPDLSPP